MNRILAITFCYFFTLQLHAQLTKQSYKHYYLEWDSLERESYLVDTIAKSKLRLDDKWSGPNRSRFVHGFVELRTGDMKVLYTLNGKKLLSPSHYIRYNQSKNLISAYICGERAWIFLDFTGDTLSMSRYAPTNYCPELKDSLNLEAYIDEAGTKCLFGYLNQEAKWQIPPIYQDAQPFINGSAKVKVNDKWGLINRKGEYIVKPKFENDQF